MITVAHCLIHPAHVFYAFADSEITIVQLHLEFKLIVKIKLLKRLGVLYIERHDDISYIICITCKCVNPVMLSVMYFNHWLRIALSSQCITPVRAPLSPLTSNAFLLSLSVPNMYLVTYAIINGTEKCYVNYYSTRNKIMFLFPVFELVASYSSSLKIDYVAIFF